MIDDLKVDLLNTDPYGIQIKATERTPQYGMILKEMKNNFPELTPAIVHKRNYQPETVTIFKEDFYDIVSKIIRLEKMEANFEQ